MIAGAGTTQDVVWRIHRQGALTRVWKRVCVLHNLVAVQAHGRLIVWMLYNLWDAETVRLVLVASLTHTEAAWIE